MDTSRKYFAKLKKEERLTRVGGRKSGYWNYSKVSDQEQQQLYETIIQHKESAMLAQYIKEKGRQEEKRENLLSFVRRSHEQGVSVSTIAKIVQLDISIVNNILNNENVDIPLHLLDSSGIS